MTLWAALETSTRAASVAVHDGERTCERALAAERAHAADLLPTLDELLAGCSRAPGELDGIVIGTGPGSYTGLRVGIATALGLARATGADLVALPSFDALAFAHLAPGERGLLVSNAHAGGLYIARYERDAEVVETLAEPCVVSPDEALEVVERHADRILADGASVSQLGLGGSRLTVGAVPSAQALLTLGMRRLLTHGPSRPEDVGPLYLRRTLSGPPPRRNASR